MQLGFTFPQYEIGADPAGIRALATAAEELGYRHMNIYDHILGVSPQAHPGWDPQKIGGPRYTDKTMFHEPFVLFGYLAALTKRMQFITGILVLPQRQTALVAKQVAEVDVLTGGRIQLGIGIGWNDKEMAGLGEDSHTRGARSEEQVQVLRMLWTQEVVTFHGKFHHIDHAGINPLPIQRPIPIWFGGGDATIDRAARLADGLMGPNPAKVRARAKELGRDISHMLYSGGVQLKGFDYGQAAERIQQAEASGVTHFTVNSLEAGLRGPDAHIAALRRFKEHAGHAWR